MNTETYNRSLPLLAQALTDQRGIRVEVCGSEACTDGKTIRVPSLPLDADDTLLGVARGYVDHESAHVLFSEFNALNDTPLSPLEKHLGNAVEDVRVEALMSEHFPGCAQNFKSTVKHVFLDKPTPCRENDNPAFAVVDYVLLRLRSQTCPYLSDKVQAAGNVVAQHFPGLITELEDVFADIKNCCPDTRSSIAYGKRIVGLLENYEKRKAEQPEECSDGDGAADNSGTSNEQTASADGGDGHAENPADAISPMQPASLAPLFAPDADLPKGLGEMLAEELEAHKPKKADDAVTTAVEVAAGFKPMPQDMLDRTFRLQASLRPLLRGSLQADTLEAAMPATQGRLNDRKLYSVPLGNQHIFTRRIPARLTQTALHILVDRSGSTSGIVKDVAVSAYAVAHAAAGIHGVSVGMSIFPVDYPEEYVTDQPGVSTLIKHGQTTPRYQDFDADGMTPIGEAIWHILPTLMKQRCSRRILAVFTDGIPDSWKKAKAALHDAHALGVETYAVSYCSDAVLRLFPENHSIVIQSIDELPLALSTMLLSALRKAA